VSATQNLLVPGVPGLVAKSKRCPGGGERAISICSTRACDIVPRKEDAISDNGRAPLEEEVPAPLRERLWFIFVMMCVLPPYGLVLFWRHEDFPPEAKWLVTFVIVGAIVWAVLLTGKR
jgi:hypothetical protein